MDVNDNDENEIYNDLPIRHSSVSSHDYWQEETAQAGGLSLERFIVGLLL